MAANSVGQIGLDLVVNKGEFESQMRSLQGLAAKAGKTLAAAFATKKLADFFSQSIKLAQVQQEAEKKLETVMRQRMRATNAAINSIKEYTSAQQSLGVVGDETQMAGAQQLATFLNTTSALKTLIPAMNNLAVQQNGVNVSAGNMVEIGNLMGKVMQGQTGALTRVGITFSKAEEQALKYGTEQERAAVLAKVITNNVGEMNRAIAETPAGQIQQLRNNFGDLMEIVGAGIQRAIIPAVRLINVLIGKLLSLANAFKSFAAFMGGSAKKGMDTFSQSAGGAGAAMEDAGESAEGAGGSAKKAAKDIKNATTGIDELNIIQPPEASEGSGGGGGGGYAAEEFDLGSMPEDVAQADAGMSALALRVKELGELFKAGFWDGLGDVSVFDSIRGNIDSIKQSLKEIFTSPEVVKAANDFANTVVYSFGQVNGSVVSMGASLADFFTGAVAKYLEQNSPRIQDYIVRMFKIEARRAEIVGEFYETVADIMEVFRGDSFKQIGADIIDAFATAFVSVTLLMMQFGVDLLELFVRPIVDNKEKIINTLNGLAGPTQQVFSTLANSIQLFGDTALRIYDSSVGPFFDSLKKGLSELVSRFLDSFNQNILPVLQSAADKFEAFASNVLPPLMEKFEETFGKASEALILLWEGAIVPFISWFIDNVAPIIGQYLQICVNHFISFLTYCSEVISSVLDILGGLIDFLVGVFTGDWERAWTGIKNFFVGIWNLLLSFLRNIFNTIVTLIELQLLLIKSGWELAWKTIGEFFSSIWNKIKEVCTNLLTAIHSFIVSKMDAVKSGVNTALENIKTTWTNIWEGLKNTTIQIFEGIWSGIKGVINRILSGVEVMANGVINAINSMIDALNGLSFDIPDWIPPEFGGGNSFGLNIPSIPTVSIPKLAQGGFVRANTPQLAMIGDNRRYGEIVAPEDKMQDMVNRAVSMVSQSSGMSEQYLAIMIDLLKKIIELIEAMDLTVNIDIREIKKQIANLDARSGFSLRTT